MIAWNRETVLRKNGSVFPDADSQAVMRTLEKYQSPNDEGGSFRVWLAILKLCEEGKGLSDLEKYLQDACMDFRDVLAWAEYPNQMRQDSWNESEARQKQLENADASQYRNWLEKP